MPIVLGIDCSKASTGAAVGDGVRPPLTFRHSFSGANHRGAVFASYRRWLLDQILMHSPSVVIFEAPLMGVARHQSSDAPRVLIGMSAVTEEICARRSISCHDVNVQTWRKQIIGKARPENPKAAVLAWCAMMGWETGGNDDRADAAGVWAYGHFMFGNRKGIAGLLSRGDVNTMRRRV